MKIHSSRTIDTTQSSYVYFAICFCGLNSINIQAFLKPVLDPRLNTGLLILILKSVFSYWIVHRKILPPIFPFWPFMLYWITLIYYHAIKRKLMAFVACRLSSWEMNSVTRVQILNLAVWISYSANTLRKDMSQTIFTIVEQTGLFNLCIVTNLERQLNSN